MSKLRTITPNEPADFTPSMGDYKTLQPFRYWCQKVLPLVYDDSLSYYELLCKVVDYLNKTMEDVETLHGDVTNLHTAYEELQSYVNNYFSTLDVQAEINNKLNEMSKDGVLSQLIEPFITENSNPIFVDNTSSMNDTTKIYVLTTNGHIYTYKNNNFVDTGMLYTFNNSDFILSNTGLSITDEYLTSNPTVNVTNLSPNTFYRVENITQEHALQLGLKEGMGVLGSIYITSPHSRTNTTQAYKLIEWNTGYRTNSRKYYAYMYGNDTVDTLTWHQIANNSNIDNVVNNTISCSFTRIDDSYLTANPNVNILTLDSNTFYRVDNLTNQHYDQLGFAPDMRGAGNLYITKPTLRSDAGYSYTLVEYTTGTLEYTKRFFTFLYGDETLSTVFWKRVADTTLNRNINLARYNNVIYLIGDSIVEGYGGSNYNGGSSSNHSDEEIPNNVKKWYRNTTGTCWANMLKSYIESNYPNTTVINNGIGGLTCAQVDDNFDTLVGTDATMVIISCGTNDRNSSSKLSSITNHISNMVNKANRRGLKCVILTNSPLRESAGGKPNNAQTINAFINNSIANTNVNNIQILSNMLSYMELNDLSINDVTNDTLHPNDQGYKIMFNIIRANLGM